jgi:hypothetical protein
MERSVQTHPPGYQISGCQEAWEMVLSQLRQEMSKAQFETWVEPLRPVTFQKGIFTVGAFNPYTRDWVESRLKSRIARMLEGLYNEPVNLQIVVSNGYYQSSEIKTAFQESETADLPAAAPPTAPANRKVMLQRAYGSERARIIQPERGMFITGYFFNEWLPRLEHSAALTILAARSLCYWNPMTGELRNTVETDMSELARRAAVSVRTVKDVLNNDDVRRYFLRYKVRRIMTPNGVRTAGITLQVRMDDPLTPEDQEASGLVEDEHWYTLDVGEEEDD